MKHNHTEDLYATIRDLKKRIAALERGRPVAGASISQGNLELRTPDGDTIMRAGEIQWGSQTAYGVEFFRQNGTRQARFFDTANGGGYWALYGEQGEILVSNDTVSGVGLATPYIPLTVTRYSEYLSPPVTTVSATFEPLFRAHAQRQHPRVRFLLATDSDADTTGEVMLTQGGAQISNVVSVPLGDNTLRWLDATVTGDHLGTLGVEVNARRTAGTGFVRVGVMWCAGVQS